jgi:hypothetical protein
MTTIRPGGDFGWAGRTGITTLVLGVLLTLAAVQSFRLRFYEPSLQLAFVIQAVLAILLAVLVLRLQHWTRWSSLLLAIVPVFAIMAAGLTTFVYFSEPSRQDFTTVYLPFGSVWATGVLAGAVVPAWLGLLLGWFVDRRVRTRKTRVTYVSCGAAALLVAALGPPLWDAAVTGYTDSHATVAGEAAMKANACTLKHTMVTPTLEHPITPGTNLLWCATFPAAWNVLADASGGAVDMTDAPAVVAILNRRDVTTNHLDATTFVADAGPGTVVVPRVKAALQQKFNGRASPELLPSPSPNLMAYAYLFVNLPFETAFERVTMLFGTTPVKGFGLTKPHAGNQRHAGKQVVIHDAGKDGFVIELLTRRADHQLILAAVTPASSLQETVNQVLSRLREKPEHADYDLLQVPILNFDIMREYGELEGHAVRTAGATGAAQPLVSARQQIRFRLDERGAVLKSEMALLLGASPTLRFDHPFLILLRVRGASRPYFAAWVDNPEILVPRK